MTTCRFASSASSPRPALRWSNLLSLQQTTTLIGATQARLSSGLKVANPIDDASAFFTAANARGRANDLSARKNEIGEAVQTIKAASEGIDAISKLIEAAKGVAESARSATTAGRSTLAAQFNQILVQIDQTANDAKYKGTNLLAASSSLAVKTNENGSSTITITGFDASSTTGLSVSAIAVSTWTVDTALDAAVTQLNTANSTLRTNSSTLGAVSSQLTIRDNFLDGVRNVLLEGADKLTVTDQNEEGANLLSLQTRQQLGVISLSLANQSQQAILRLF
jgi:flagellin-like hook-associated protein FlgL